MIVNIICFICGVIVAIASISWIFNNEDASLLSIAWDSPIKWFYVGVFSVLLLPIITKVLFIFKK